MAMPFDELLRASIATVAATALALPETYEEDAWIGVRWRIRQRTFAHVAPVDGRSPAFERAAARAKVIGPGPYVVLTFRSDGEELDTLTKIGHPYFKPEWSPTIVGEHLTADTDWDEIAELVTESYCLLAPKKLAVLVERPGS